MYKLLIVDDEKEIRNLIVKYVTFEGNEAEEVLEGETERFENRVSFEVYRAAKRPFR